MAVRRSPLILTDPVESDGGILPDLKMSIVAGSLDDRGLLRVMTTPLSQPTPRTTMDDLLRAIAAEELLKLGGNVSGGPMLAQTIAGIMKRFIRFLEVRKESLHRLPVGTVTHLYDLLAYADSGAEKIQLGVQLGDHGLHLAAGWGDGVLHVTRSFGERMAKTGYGTAIAAASRVPQAELSRRVASSIGPLMQQQGLEGRLAAVVDVLAGIRSRIASQGELETSYLGEFGFGVMPDA